MKICIVQGAFFPVPPVLGGAVEKMWFELAKVFAQQGHEVTQISRSYPRLASSEITNGVHHQRVAGDAQPANALVLKFCDFLYSLRASKFVPRDAEIVVSNTFWTPLLLSRHKGLVYADIQRMPKGQCRIYPRTTFLRANSTPVKKAIESELPLSEHLRVTMIPNPLPFTPSVSSRVEKAKIVLYCGRVHPEKGLELLVHASKNLPVDWQVKIVGPWETGQGGGGFAYRQELEKRATGAQVEFLGPVYDMEQLNALYRQAALFVYPSVAEKGETFGLAPLEAMAWGCVPVVSDLACFKDFIVHEQNGLIFDHRSSHASASLHQLLVHLIQHPSQCAELSARALAVRDSHSSLRIAGDFLSDFERGLQWRKSL